MTAVAFRAAKVVAGCIVILLAVYGLAFHTPARRILGLGGASCPFAAGQSSTQREALRRREAQALRGSAPAIAHPALGFALSGMTRARLDDWIAQMQARCSIAVLNGALECKVDDAAYLPESSVRGPATLFFTFDADDRLKGVQLQAPISSPGAAVSTMQEVRARLERDLSAPARVTGELTTNFVAAAALRQVVAEFRFADYYASAKVTNMGALGYYTLSETYMALD